MMKTIDLQAPAAAAAVCLPEDQDAALGVGKLYQYFSTKANKGGREEEEEKKDDCHDEIELGNDNDAKTTPQQQNHQQIVTEEDQILQEQLAAESLKLNTAFSSLEHMRKANLEVEYGGKAVGDISLFHQYCTVCLKEQKDKEETFLKSNENTERRKWRKSVMSRLTAKKNKSPPCLICACPVCPKHGCRDFKREGISICGHCAPLFTMDFVVDTISNDSEEHRRQCIAHMVDSYDRALLMIRYSSQFIEDIASALESNTRKNDQIGLGSSGVGLMSGFTGVAAVAAHFAAAATILSPAGPPLIIASILFGGTAAAASTSSEAINYYSEPNQLANKILALHELVHSLLAVTAVMKGALQRGHIDAQQYIEIKGRGRRIKFQSSASSDSLDDDNSNSDDGNGGHKQKQLVTTDIVVVEGVAGDIIDEAPSGMDDTSTSSGNDSLTAFQKPAATSTKSTTKVIKAPNNTRVAISRTATNSMKVFQAASIACVALSAATIVLEAKNMNDTLESLRAGSPCEKAQILRQIKKEVDQLPATKIIADECESYLEATTNKSNLY